jgi:hypothetical protein
MFLRKVEQHEFKERPFDERGQICSIDYYAGPVAASKNSQGQGKDMYTILFYAFSC